MGLFSKLFAAREPSAEELISQKLALLSRRLRDVTLRFTHKRIVMQEGEKAVGLDRLQRLSDTEVSGLPEQNVVIMAAIYRRFIGEGASHENGLLVVNSSRVFPVKWGDTSKFKSIEEYINERLKVELAAADAKLPLLKYFTQDFVASIINETNQTVDEVLGYKI